MEETRIDTETTPSARRQLGFECWLLFVLALTWVITVGPTSDAYVGAATVMPMDALRRALRGLFYRPYIF